MDRIPWPDIRTYLVEHQEISLDDFAAAYSTQFSILWNYDPKLVVMNHPSISTPAQGKVTINPIYEEHIRQLKNWSVSEMFRNRFPEMGQIIDQSLSVP